MRSLAIVSGFGGEGVTAEKLYKLMTGEDLPGQDLEDGGAYFKKIDEEIGKK